MTILEVFQLCKHMDTHTLIVSFWGISNRFIKIRINFFKRIFNLGIWKLRKLCPTKIKCENIYDENLCQVDISNDTRENSGAMKE